MKIILEIIFNLKNIFFSSSPSSGKRMSRNVGSTIRLVIRLKTLFEMLPLKKHKPNSDKEIIHLWSSSQIAIVIDKRISCSHPPQTCSCTHLGCERQTIVLVTDKSHIFITHPWPYTHDWQITHLLLHACGPKLAMKGINHGITKQISILPNHSSGR